MSEAAAMTETARATRGERERSPELVVIAGAARSGTTLVRALLDAHPEIGCPAEADLPGLIAHMWQTWATVCTGLADSPKDEMELPMPQAEGPFATALPESAVGAIRAAIERIMRHYCATKRLYCDKSLGNAERFAAVERVFPETKCVIVTRHVMDTVASGLESSIWGYSGFGYEPYVRESPDNVVEALARYWERQTTLALDWCAANRHRCHLLRYEDLVLNPEDTLRALLTFLDVDHDMSVITRGPKSYRQATGPGDHKLADRPAITPRSVGCGKRVPTSMIAPKLRERLNELLTRLGYPSMTPRWNLEPRGVNLAPAEVRRALSERMRTMQPGSWEYPIESIAVIADDDAESRWVVTPSAGEVQKGDGSVDLVVLGAANDLMKMMSGESNLGLQLRAGLIRAAFADEQQRAPDIAKLLRTLASRFTPPG